jgi:hypothetical protein
MQDNDLLNIIHLLGKTGQAKRISQHHSLQKSQDIKISRIMVVISIISLCKENNLTTPEMYNINRKWQPEASSICLQTSKCTTESAVAGCQDRRIIRHSTKKKAASK